VIVLVILVANAPRRMPPLKLHVPTIHTNKFKHHSPYQSNCQCDQDIIVRRAPWYVLSDLHVAVRQVRTCKAARWEWGEQWGPWFTRVGQSQPWENGKHDSTIPGGLQFRRRRYKSASTKGKKAKTEFKMHGRI